MTYVPVHVNYTQPFSAILSFRRAPHLPYPGYTEVEDLPPLSAVPPTPTRLLVGLARVGITSEGDDWPSQLLSLVQRHVMSPPD